MTGSESSYEDVNAPVAGLIVLEVGVDDFERLVVGESDLTYVVEGIGDQREEMVSILDGFGDGFVEIFSKLTPEAVEHEFSRGFASMSVHCDRFSMYCYCCLLVSNIYLLNNIDRWPILFCLSFLVVSFYLFADVFQSEMWSDFFSSTPEHFQPTASLVKSTVLGSKD